MFIPRSAARKILKKTVPAQTWRSRGAAFAEPLEQRYLLAAATISNGSGAGSLAVTVDPYGAYGSATSAGNAIYQPVGAAAAGTTYQSGLFFTPAADFLTESSFAATPQPAINFISATTDTAVSGFDVAGFHVALTQNVGAIAGDGTTTLTQQYV